MEVAWTTTSTLLDKLHDPAEQEAWSRLYAWQAPVVLRFAQRSHLTAEDAEDVVQEVFGTVAQRYESYRPERGDLRGWLFGIARNKVLEAQRRIEREGAAPLPGEPTDPRTMRDTWNDEWWREVFRRIVPRVRTQVSDSTWDAFWQVAVEGLPADEVGVRLGMSRDMVYYAKSSVLKRLKAAARDDGAL